MFKLFVFCFSHDSIALIHNLCEWLTNLFRSDIYKPYLNRVFLMCSVFILVFISLCYYNFLSINILERKLQILIQTTVDVTKRFHGFYINADSKHYDEGVHFEKIDNGELGIIVKNSGDIHQLNNGMSQLKNEIEEIIGSDLLWTVAVIEKANVAGEVTHFLPLREAYISLDESRHSRNSWISRTIAGESIDKSYRIFNENNVRLTEPYYEKGSSEYIRSILYPVYIDKEIQAIIIVDFKNALIETCINKYNKENHTTLALTDVNHVFSYRFSLPHSITKEKNYISWNFSNIIIQALLFTIIIIIIINVVISFYRKTWKDYYYDSMTGFYRRDHYEPKLNKMTNASVIICDIDHFKSINDTYGHDVGDMVIHEVTKRIRKSIRDTDIAIRWGGEEFVIILPKMKCNDLIHKSEHIRKSVSFGKINEISVTISLGCTHQNPGENIISTLKRADKALYQSKSLGRNKTTFL